MSRHGESSSRYVFVAQDIVRLVGGGPNMLVNGPGTADGQVWCTWFSGRLHHGGSFNPKLLIRVTGTEKADATQIGDPRMLAGEAGK